MVTGDKPAPPASSPHVGDGGQGDGGQDQTPRCWEGAEETSLYHHFSLIYVVVGCQLNTNWSFHIYFLLFGEKKKQL